MKFRFFDKPFWKKFWPLIAVFVLLVGFGSWYRFFGPGEFSAHTLKAYNTVLAAIMELRRNPNNFEAAVQAGVGYYNLSNMNKAEEYYLKATGLDPTSALPWNNLGNTYRELLRFEDAESAYLKAISLQSEIPTSYLNLANLYNRWPVDEFDRHPRILPVLLQALEATNRDMHILRALVDYYDNQGDAKRAEQYREEIDRQNTGDINPPDKA